MTKLLERKDGILTNVMGQFLPKSSRLNHYIVTVGMFLVLTLWRFYSVSQIGFSEFLSTERFHELLPLGISFLLFACHYCLLSDIGYIEVFLDQNGNLVDLIQMDLEHQQNISLAARTRKIYYLRYITWIFGWPLLIFHLVIQANGSNVGLLNSPERSLATIFLVEILVSALLITSFSYRAIKVVFGMFSMVIQAIMVYLVIDQVEGWPEIGYFWAISTFFTTWFAYVILWVLNEAVDVLGDRFKEVGWSVLDVLQFIVVLNII